MGIWNEGYKVYKHMQPRLLISNHPNGMRLL